MCWRRGAGVLAAAGLGLALIALGSPAVAASDTDNIAARLPANARAQDVTQPRRTPRITVVPLSRYYRKCDFWLAVEHRPSGDVITPQQRCVWAAR